MISQIVEAAQKLPKDYLYSVFLSICFFCATGWTMYESINLKIDETRKSLKENQEKSEAKIYGQLDKQKQEVIELKRFSTELSSTLESIKEDTSFIKSYYLQKGLEGG